MHVPFCYSKCAYCDFYSYGADVAVYEEYTKALCKHLESAGERLQRCCDTLYFGGGTPSLLGGERIARLIKAAKRGFEFTKDAEITVEVNPADNLRHDFELMAEAGVNRLSLGVQSAIDTELTSLSRRHCNSDVERTVKDARKAGINNISLDLMLGIPHQTMETLKASLDFLLVQEPTHISCYMLKIEPETPFGKTGIEKLCLPDEDATADMYLFTSEYLRANGFEHYEISNFAKPGYRSRHNTKYWLCEEYLGLGPAAYSYLNGKRFRFERDSAQYLSCPTAVSDGDGGDFFEYCMLRLRLSDGIDFAELSRRFGREKTDILKAKAERFKSTELLTVSDSKLSLTVKGFLVSNTVISELLF